MKRETLKAIIKSLKRKITIRSLIVIALLLSANTYAWFIYSTRVEGGITAKVRSWDVSFRAGEDEITQEITIDVNEIYPGMTTFVRDINITNGGDTPASLTYKVNSYNLLGTSYVQGDDNDLMTDLTTNYPFSISFNNTSNYLNKGDETTFSVSVSWPYESGNDNLDTYWGNESYHFISSYPELPGLSINLQIEVVQAIN